jgi:hypothetical protein
MKRPKVESLGVLSDMSDTELRHLARSYAAYLADRRLHQVADLPVGDRIRVDMINYEFLRRGSQLRLF